MAQALPTWTGIVKVRKRQSGRIVIIFSEDRSINWRGAMSAELFHWFGRGKEFYAHAELLGTVVNIKKKAREQSW